MGQDPDPTGKKATGEALSTPETRAALRIKALDAHAAPHRGFLEFALILMILIGVAGAVETWDLLFGADDPPRSRVSTPTTTGSHSPGGNGPANGPGTGSSTDQLVGSYELQTIDWVDHDLDDKKLCGIVMLGVDVRGRAGNLIVEVSPEDPVPLRSDGTFVVSEADGDTLRGQFQTSGDQVVLNATYEVPRNSCTFTLSSQRPDSASAMMT